MEFRDKFFGERPVKIPGKSLRIYWPACLLSAIAVAGSAVVFAFAADDAKPDGTDAPAYSLLHVGNRVQTGKFPIQGTLPGFLRERFEPWIRGLGINNIETGQP